MSEHNIEKGDTIRDWNGTEHYVNKVDGAYVAFVDEYGQHKFTHVDNVEVVE